MNWSSSPPAAGRKSNSSSAFSSSDCCTSSCYHVNQSNFTSKTESGWIRGLLQHSSRIRSVRLRRDRGTWGLSSRITSSGLTLRLPRRPQVKNPIFPGTSLSPRIVIWANNLTEKRSKICEEALLVEMKGMKLSPFQFQRNL